jgi:hypothetical protein
MADNLCVVAVVGEMSRAVTDSLVGREKFSIDRDNRKSEGLYGDIRPSFGGGLGRVGVVGKYGMASVVGDVGSSSPISILGSSFLTGKSVTGIPRISLIGS